MHSFCTFAWVKMRPDPHKQEKSRKYQAAQNAKSKSEKSGKEKEKNGKHETAEKTRPSLSKKAAVISKKTIEERAANGQNQKISEKPMRKHSEQIENDEKRNGQKKVNEPGRLDGNENSNEITNQKSEINASQKKEFSANQKNEISGNQKNRNLADERNGNTGNQRNGYQRYENGSNQRNDQVSTSRDLKKNVTLLKRKKEIPAQQRAYLIPEEEDEEDVEIRGTKLKELLETFENMQVKESHSVVSEAPNISASAVFDVDSKRISMILKDLPLYRKLLLNPGEVDFEADQIISQKVTRAPLKIGSPKSTSKIINSKATVIVKVETGGNLNDLPAVKTAKKESNEIDAALDDILG